MKKEEAGCQPPGDLKLGEKAEKKIKKIGVTRQWKKVRNGKKKGKAKKRSSKLPRGGGNRGTGGFPPYGLKEKKGKKENRCRMFKEEK